MTIDIMVGLPHLGDGIILNRAVDMRVPGLVSANALSRWSRRKGWPEWQGWNLGQLANARRLASLSLDSAGYVALARYGGFPWSNTDYLTLAASYPFRRSEERRVGKACVSARRSRWSPSYSKQLIQQQ